MTEYIFFQALFARLGIPTSTVTADVATEPSQHGRLLYLDAELNRDESITLGFHPLTQMVVTVKANEARS
ncbi:MAG: hypothetical protein ACPGVG_16750 [Mycobacterium sp.]